MAPKSANPSSSRYYRPDIDGLRALAILFVVFFHTFPENIKGGFIGVDIFFVISGFLISGIIFNSLSKNTFSFFDFYARRIRRIFPALIFLFSVLLLVGYFFSFPSEFRTLTSEVKYGAIFWENMRLIQESGGYWDVQTELKPLMQLWTLGVEEQYYLFYPFICWLLWRLNHKHIPIALWLLFLISFGCCLVTIKDSPLFAFYSLPTRFWELCAGAILAWYVQPFSKGANFNVKLPNFFTIAGLVLIFVAFLFYSNQTPFPSNYTLVPVLGTCLVILGEKSWINSKLLSFKPIVFIGLISYTWYLWHWPLLAFSRIVNNGDLPQFHVRLILLLSGLLLALVSYYFIEKPIRKRKISPRLVVSLCAGMLVCFGLATFIRSNNGLPERINIEPSILSQFEDKIVSDQKEVRKRYGFKNGDWIFTAKKDPLPTIAVTGDSHARHLVYGLSEVTGKNVLMIGEPSLSPIKNFVHKRKRIDYNDPSKNIVNEQINILSSDKNTTTVILSGYWSNPLNPGARKSDYFFQDGSGDFEQDFQQNLEATIRELTKSGKKVIVLDETPNFYFEIYSCLKRPTLGISTNSECRESISTINERTKRWHKIFSLLKNKFSADKNVLFLDVREPFCNKENCYAKKGDDFYYYDKHHLTEKGSVALANYLKKQIETLSPEIYKTMFK